MPMNRVLLGWLLAATAACAVGWTPIKDEAYLQEIGHKIETDGAINTVAVANGIAFAGLDQGLRRVVDFSTLEEVPDAPAGPILKLKTVDDVLYLFTDTDLYALREKTWTKLAAGVFYDVCSFNEKAIVCSETQLFEVKDDELTLLPGADAPVKMRAVAAYAETLYCMGLDRLMVYDGSSIEFTRVIDFGLLPSKDVRDVLPLDNRLLVATYFGMAELRGAAVRTILGADGLPYEACTALAPGFDKDYWIATPHGAVRWVKGKYEVFNGPRWLPNDDVQGITAGPSTVYIATRKGLGIIDYQPFTLEKKASFYEKHLDAWGQKRMAFTHELHWNRADKTWLREVSDNDVGWSTHYWASQMFKYAVTKDPVARQNAIDGFNAMKWSEEITGIPGFPARAIWATGETGIKSSSGSGGYPAEWHPTPDGRFEWKGDTSSDEIDAQVYYTAVFHDLIDDDRLKDKAKEHIDRLVSHLVDNGYKLIDVDGQPTRWGHWDPEYFSSWEGMMERGLSSLEMLSYVTTALKLTGDEKFRNALDDLIEKKYPQHCVFQKLTIPAEAINHSDDRLAFYVYYPLLDYEKDPTLRSHYRRSLERSWEIERIEQEPWFNFIYGARSGADCEVETAVDHLRDWPLDLVSYTWDQSNRNDLMPPRGYQPYADGSKPISPRERGPMRWSDNGMSIQGRGGAMSVRDPSGWLDAYWMGRYFGMILPPTETNDFDDKEFHFAGNLGAAPYNGPPMPDVLGASAALATAEN